MNQRTVTINGVAYDGLTGLPVSSSPSQTATAAAPSFTIPKVHHSQTIHRTSQKSQTLNRQTVRKMDLTKKSAQPIAIKPSAVITKFAPHPTGSTKPAKAMDIGPMSHPVAAKAQRRMDVAHTVRTTPQSVAPKAARIIKEEAIAAAFDAAPARNVAHIATPKHPRAHSRTFSIMSASFALILLGGYFTYLNMPSLSVRVAAAQAGVNASYPGYHPDGYSVNGPVAYSQGAVSMKFAANGGPQSYTINQQKSAWDSSAVLENYVNKKVGGGYVQHNEHGLTIYTFNNSAAWVNNGILYTIEGNAPLSSDQILHIASSM
jgi:hypothetical protein